MFPPSMEFQTTIILTVVHALPLSTVPFHIFLKLGNVF